MKKYQRFAAYMTDEGEAVSFPVCCVEGAVPGPVVCVTAGVHGCEYPGISAAIRLYQRLDPQDVRGTVRIVPIVNMGAFRERHMFVCPEDEKNLNRVMPGTPEGSFSEVLAYHLFEDYIRGSDVYLDLHGGDMVEDLVPFSLVHRGKDDAVFRRSLELAEYFGLEHIVLTSDSGGWNDKGTTYANAAKIGIPAILAEVGHIGQLTAEHVERHLKGLESVLRHVGVLKGTPEKKRDYTYYDQFLWLRSTTEGFFNAACKVGQNVTKGQELGFVENCFGERLETVTAPATGDVLFLTTSPAMKKDGLLLSIGIEKTGDPRA